MIWQFVVAGGIAALAAVIHAVMGERTDVRSLWRSDVPLNEKIELRGTWHAFSAVLALTALTLFVIGLTNRVESPRTLAHVIAVTHGLTGLAWLLVTLRSGLRQAVQVPQWVLLWVVAGLAWWGASAL